MCSYIATTELRQRRYVVVFGLFTHFFVHNLIMLFMAFVELLMLVGAFFSVYEIIWLFVLSCRTLK
jgi:hypothetical protein